MPKRGVQIGLVVLVVAAIAVVVLVNRGPRPAPAAAAPQPSTVAAEVTGVRPGADDRSVVVVVSVPECAGEPRVELLTEENDVVYANVVTTVLGECAGRKPAEVVVATPGPIGARPLMLNSLETWGRVNGTYARCDEHLGCAPPADHCADAWVDRTVSGMDVPVKRLHGAREVRGCDGDWLVLDVNRSVGDCPPADGAPSCDVPDRTSRVFFEWRDGWSSFAGTTDAGCAPALAVRPAFPEALCASLPAP